MNSLVVGDDWVEVVLGSFFEHSRRVGDELLGTAFGDGDGLKHAGVVLLLVVSWLFARTAWWLAMIVSSKNSSSFRKRPALVDGVDRNCSATLR